MNPRLWAALAEIQDPEMPINLVDLGVIYGLTEKDGVIDVDLTFTAMGCPASDFILEDVRERLLREPGVSEVRVKDGTAVDVYADRGGPLIASIVNAAQGSGAELRDVHISEPSLETLFLHHTGRSLRD